MTRTLLIAILALACSLATGPLAAVEVVTLTPDTWDEHAPDGKEVDCIYGDIALRNSRLCAVIAKGAPGRNANMTVREVGGAIIDLTQRSRQNDQLSAFYPGAAQAQLSLSRLIVDGETLDDADPESFSAEGRTLRLIFRAAANATAQRPAAVIEYELADESPFILVKTTYVNRSQARLSLDLTDGLRADRSFVFGVEREQRLFWAFDEWWGQAYGVLCDDHQIETTGGARPQIRYRADGGAAISLAPGQSHTLVRKVFPAANLLELKGIADEIGGSASAPVQLTVKDAAGPVAGALVTLFRESDKYAWARTGEDGKLAFQAPQGDYRVMVEALGRPAKEASLAVRSETERTIELEQPGYVVAKVTDGEGRAIPCKVAFHGRDGTESPFFAPDTFIYDVHNLRYTPNGEFRQEIGPGKYDVVVSYGPEHDAHFTTIEVARGRETRLEAKLPRSVDTTGWISSDFHSHSSPSGDNTSSQLGRVLNLLAEHIEFAPCTEHNRISTYEPHLKTLKAERLMATCSGMELTGSPLPINHQNAFPLVHKPRTQDGGGPQTDVNPVVQIERLALWDNNADKVVQGNHPNLVQILGDRDLDGKPDGGFEKMFGFMDIVEVHPLQDIFTPQTTLPNSRDRGKPIFHWLQMLNLGYRLPGVVNTDAHYNFHGSGWLRNFIKSPTDDPAEVEIDEIIHAAEHGWMVMSNGPFLEVSAQAQSDGKTKTAGVGDNLAAPDGKATLAVRVQCPNWLDINRVQVFVNGKPAPEWNFTRKATPDRFGSGAVKFEQRIELSLDRDAHLVVAAAGEGLSLSRVMGEQYGKQMPMAVSNPIFIDVDGDGFAPNGDMLGLPLPVAKDHKPSHGHHHHHHHHHDDE